MGKSRTPLWDHCGRWNFVSCSRSFFQFSVIINIQLRTPYLYTEALQYSPLRVTTASEMLVSTVGLITLA